MDIPDNAWMIRIRREQRLILDYPATASFLTFHEMVLRFQQKVAGADESQFRQELPLRNQIDLALALTWMPELLTLTLQSASQLLATRARELQRAGPDAQHDFLRLALSTADAPEHETDSFFAHACLQPLAENLQSQLHQLPDSFQNTCPACGGYPQAAVLRPEGDGGRRWLLCSFCLREWVFRRVVCPWCGEEDKQKLPSYSAEIPGHVRIQACDTCGRYLKAIDMTVDGNAVPLIDEVAFVVLDLWATEHGYSKIARNLLGF